MSIAIRLARDGPAEEKRSRGDPRAGKSARGKPSKKIDKNF